MSIKYNRPIHGISQDVMQSLLNHSWPGNIRELKNVIERIVVLSENGEIKANDLPIELNKLNSPSDSTEVNHEAKQTTSTTLNEQLNQFEAEIIFRELKKAQGNKLQCAKNLGITRATLYNKMKKLNINY